MTFWKRRLKVQGVVRFLYDRGQHPTLDLKAIDWTHVSASGHFFFSTFVKVSDDNFLENIIRVMRHWNIMLPWRQRLIPSIHPPSLTHLHHKKIQSSAVREETDGRQLFSGMQKFYSLCTPYCQTVNLVRYYETVNRQVNF